jgi:hypothetical protein
MAKKAMLLDSLTLRGLKRLRRPKHKNPPLGQRDRHVLWLHEANIAFIRVPKAASSSVRYLLAKKFRLRQIDDKFKPNNDRFWDLLPDAEVTRLSLAEFERQRSTSNPWSFSIVRHPVSRLYSCWNNKIRENNELSPRFCGMGVELGMEFPDFVDLVCGTPDEYSDIHTVSQSRILTYRGELVPDYCAHMETLLDDWEEIRRNIALKSGIEMGSLLKKNKRISVSENISKSLSQATLDLIRKRYHEDFERFYPFEL